MAGDYGETRSNEGAETIDSPIPPFLMPSWTLVNTHPTQGRTFQRPLGASELGFYWDGVFNGTTDSLQYFHLRLSNGARDARLFSEDNIASAWVSTKRRYPLSGAVVQGAASDSQTSHGDDGGRTRNTSMDLISEFRFVVREHDLAIVRPSEIVFGRVTSAEDAQQRITAILDGPRPLSDELLVRLYVFRESESESAGGLHLMILVAHCVTDGMANRTFARCLLDTLARGKGSDPAQISLEERLEMAIPSEELEPVRPSLLSPAVRRWRRAAAAVILNLRIAELQGGYTLPCRLTPSTPWIPAQSRLVSALLTATETTAVIVNCRQYGITFGSAYLILAQVAMTRVLYRRYLYGEISEEEWAYRKRQPYITVSPLNRRPYLDKTWFENGGAGEFMMSIGIFFGLTPFMTIGETEGGKYRHVASLSGGSPPFSELLSFGRFLHRVRLVKKQMNTFFGHPLFNEIMHAQGIWRLEDTRSTALRWTQRHKTSDKTHGNKLDSDKVMAVTEMPVVLAHGGSSLGNVDLMTPTEYPLPPTHPLSPDSSKPHPFKAGYVTPPSPSASGLKANTTPKVTVEKSSVHLHTRPGELYLGAATSRGQMSMYVHYDGNVFEEEVVKEWLDEVREAVLWYLCNVGSAESGH